MEYGGVFKMDYHTVLTKQDIVELIRLDNLSRQLNIWHLFSLSDVGKLRIKYGNLVSKSVTAIGIVGAVPPPVVVLLKLYKDCITMSGKFANNSIKIHFYGITVERVEEILKHFDTIANSWSYMIDDRCLILIHSSVEYRYRIIIDLNIYTTKSILISHVSLDISQNMIFYDGTEYMFTMLGAISNSLRLNIVGAFKPNERKLSRGHENRFSTLLPELISINMNLHIKLNSVVFNLEKNSQFLGIGDVSNVITHIPKSFPLASTGFELVLKYVNIYTNEINALTYKELVTNPYYKDRETIKSMIFENDRENIRIHMKIVYVVLGSTAGKQYMSYLFDSKTIGLSTEDQDSMNGIILTAINYIMNQQTEHILTRNKPITPVIVNRSPPVAESSVKWYGSYYEDIGMRTAPEVFNTIDTCDLSDNMRQVLLQQQFNINFDVYAKKLFD